MTETLLSNDLDPEDQIDPSKNYTDELVGEGKKFKTVEDMAKGKYIADLTIKTKDKRFDELRSDYERLTADYNSRAKLEELLDRAAKPLASSEPPLAKEVEDKPLKPEDLSALVSKEFQKHETNKREQENLKQVQAKIKERFGNNSDALKTHLEDLGLTEMLIVNLAKQNPIIVLRTLGLEQQAPKEDYIAPPRSSRRNDSFSPTTKKRTWSYYQDLKKNNRELYYDPKTSNQMIEDYRALGKDFEDGDFDKWN